ncbi:MAG: hypothetical protein GY861_05910, partial [bacterium]|nr:hypothetical protein [bacterium]
MDFSLIIELLERAMRYNDTEPLRLAINHIENSDIPYPPVIKSDIQSVVDDLCMTGVAE